MITPAQYQAWLKAENVQRVLLVEASYYAGDEEKTAYLASMPFVSTATDIPPHQPYADVVLDTPKFTAALGDALQGYTVPSWGDILIDNSDASRDGWLEYSWDGRSVTVLFGDPSWPRTDFKPILSGTVAGISFPSSSQIKLSIKDKQWALNVPIQSHLVGEPELISGTTYRVSEDPVESIDAIWDNGVLLDPSKYTTSPLTTPATFTLVRPPVGKLTCEYTGGSTATGQVVPLCFGEVCNITPVTLSASLLTYQAHGGPVDAIVQVRDNGVPIGFVADLDRGTFQLLSNPVGTVTCDVRGATSGGVFVQGVGRIVRHILITCGGLTVADIDHDSLRVFLDLCPQRAGIYIDSRRNTLDVLDELITSVGGFYTPNREGKLIFGRLDPPEGTPVLELTADDLVMGGLKIVKQSVPWQTARIAYLRNYTVQDSTAGAVPDVDKAVYAHEWRYVSRQDPSIALAHLLASEPTAQQTCLVDRTEAIEEAARLLELNGTVRTTYSAECISLPLTVNQGAVVRLTHPRYGLAAGKLLRVVGINESVINRRVTFTLWG